MSLSPVRPGKAEMSDLGIMGWHRRMVVQLVWFKRDLRVVDHAPLAAAAARGPVLPLFIVEPALLAAPDFDPAHWTFLRASLAELRESLARRGQPLAIRVGEAVPILEGLRRQVGIEKIWAHEETSNGLSYARDREVRRWARASGVAMEELPANGVVRRLASRNGWAKQWEARMARAVTPAPALLRSVDLEAGGLPTHAELGLGGDTRRLAQPGGEAAAHAMLNSFLAERGAHYHRDLSSPLTAFDGCSRLSAHLAWGTLSTRQIVQRTRARAEHAEGDWKRALRAFDARLHWRCHFMQKLEDEPEIEFRNFMRSYDGLREDDFDGDRFSAWQHGLTGYPLVDACMRCLQETGWINFRMRAMLMSFAAYHLWLHWRKPALHLARLFVDYEPGIHYSQAQMQSGTTGINTLRIYSPTKQAQDQDPHGVFIRRWIPELRDVPDAGIAMPWLYPSLLQSYPLPIVEHAVAVRQARARLSPYRRQAVAREEADGVAQKHGSRKGGARAKPKRRATEKPEPAQGSLFSTLD